MTHRSHAISLLIVFSLLLSACGGGNNGSGMTGARYTLNPSQIPIAMRDPLVTVTVGQATTKTSLLDSLKDFALPVWNAIIPSAIAAQITPSISGKATAKVVAGQVELINPVFTSTVTVPDPAHPGKTIDKTVTVRCDVSSTPTTIRVNDAWVLNNTTGDLLLNMDYPVSVSADFDPTTETFSACTFVYAQGYFIVYGDGSVSTLLDSSRITPKYQAGCSESMRLPFTVIAAGDPSRNNSNTPIINTLQDQSLFDGNTNTYYPGPTCGYLTALSYSKAGGQAYTTLNFSTGISRQNTDIVVDASQRVFAVGLDRSYADWWTNRNCPIATTLIGDTSSTCITLPASKEPAYFYASSLLIDQTGKPLLAVQPYTYRGPICAAWIANCGMQDPLPIFFDVDATSTVATYHPTALTASIVASGLFSLGLPSGTKNGFMTYLHPGLANGMLVDISANAKLLTCTNVFGSTEFGCTNNIVSEGDYLYGFVGCAFNGATPGTCINTPTANRVNTATGSVDRWDLTALGYLPVGSISNSSNTVSLPVDPIFYTDQVVFLACPSPNLNCSSPAWVSLDFATGTITPIASGGITFDMLASDGYTLDNPRIRTTLW